MVTNEEREQRYAGAILGASSLWGEYDADDQVERVMAVADAEQAELRAEVASARQAREIWRESSSKWKLRAEAAEEIVATIRAALDGE